MFSVWLRERMKAIDLEGTNDLETADDLRRLLARFGIVRGNSTISYWLTGDRVPERSIFGGLLDALGVVGKADRARATELWLASQAARESLHHPTTSS